MIVGQRDYLRAESIGFSGYLFAPASRYSAWIALITSGRVRLSRSLLPFRIGWVVLKPLAAKILLGQLVPLYHGTHCAVNNQYAFL